ncbi:MAG: hypothetical protein JNN13_19175 [Planctomycetes bacterium]|nr:hypothetical protein [Planctomycetota bacterium]
MNFLRNLDLYKVIVLLSLVLLPAGYWYITTLDQQIEACNRAVTEATKSGGQLEQIGQYQRRVEIVAQNRRSASDAIKEPRTYFEGQILAAGGSGLKTTDFSPAEPKIEKGTLPGSKQPIADHVVDISWKRERDVPLEFVYAVMWNCESGAQAGGAQAGQPSVWKLRSLTITNNTDKNLVSAKKTPPPELEDRWVIDEMKFARREPRKDKD